MGQSQALPVVQEARSLLQLFMNLSENELARHADDILLYLRKLHDQYQIRKSRSPRFSGSTFFILENVMYELEAHPDETLRSSDFREFIMAVLSDISSLKIEVVARKL